MGKITIRVALDAALHARAGHLDDTQRRRLALVLARWARQLEDSADQDAPHTARRLTPILLRARSHVN
jgi:hypothetical protein